MSNFTEGLSSDIEIFEKGHPENLPELDQREIVLQKEISRGMFLIELLEGTIGVVENPEDEASKRQMIRGWKKTLKHYTESGGAGSEALTRLMGIGLIEELPKITIEKNPNVLTKLFEGDDTLSALETIPNEDKMKLRLFFEAKVPDDEGNETWRQRDNEVICTTEIELNLSNVENLKEFLDTTKENYRETLDLKYEELYRDMD